MCYVECYCRASWEAVDVFQRKRFATFSTLVTTCCSRLKNKPLVHRFLYWNEPRLNSPFWSHSRRCIYPPCRWGMSGWEISVQFGDHPWCQTCCHSRLQISPYEESMKLVLPSVVLCTSWIMGEGFPCGCVLPCQWISNICCSWHSE